jgi:hypothetical protein
MTNEMATRKNYGYSEIELFHVFADMIWNRGEDHNHEYTMFTCLWGSTPRFMEVA